MAIGLSNPNGSVGVSTPIDPVGANAFFAPGVVGGFHTTPTSPAGMKVNVGGSYSDSALVQSSTGVIYPLGNTDGSAIEVTIPAAPSTNKRIDSIVLYVDPTVTATATNGTDTCGIEVVSGTSAANPVPPTGAQIKAVVGAGSAYLVIANITVNSAATTITASDIAEVNRTDKITASNIDFTTTPWLYIGGATGSVIPTDGSNAPLRVVEQFNNSFCTVDTTANTFTFTKDGTYIITATTGRDSLPGQDTRFSGGIAPNGQTVGRILVYEHSIPSGEYPYRITCAIARISSGIAYRFYLASGSLNNCTTLQIKIAPLM